MIWDKQVKDLLADLTPAERLALRDRFREKNAEGVLKMTLDKDIDELLGGDEMLDAVAAEIDREKRAVAK